MKKSLLVVAALGVMGVSAVAAELSPSCEEYFKLVDEFVEKNKRQSTNGSYEIHLREPKSSVCSTSKRLSRGRLQTCS